MQAVYSRAWLNRVYRDVRKLKKSLGLKQKVSDELEKIILKLNEVDPRGPDTDNSACCVLFTDTFTFIQ